MLCINNVDYEREATISLLRYDSLGLRSDNLKQRFFYIPKATFAVPNILVSGNFFCTAQKVILKSQQQQTVFYI